MKTSQKLRTIICMVLLAILYIAMPTKIEQEIRLSSNCLDITNSSQFMDFDQISAQRPEGVAINNGPKDQDSSEFMNYDAIAATRIRQ